MSLRVITAPSELLTVSDVADFMKIDYPDDESSVIGSMITAARQWCEEYLQRAIGVQTLELTLPAFPKRTAILLRPPVISVTSINYTDTSGSNQTLSASEYLSAITLEPGEIVPVSSWPDTYNTPDAVKVRYQAGYYAGGSPATSIEIPKTIHTAILMQIADLYENREGQSLKTLSVNPTLERLLSTYRLEMGI